MKWQLVLHQGSVTRRVDISIISSLRRNFRRASTAYNTLYSTALHRPIYCIIFAESKIISNYPFTGIKVTRTDLQASQLFASLHSQCAGDWEIYVSYWQITDAFGNLQSVGNTSQQASRYIMYITLCNNTGHGQTCMRCFTMFILFIDVVQYLEKVLTTECPKKNVV